MRQCDNQVKTTFQTLKGGIPLSSDQVLAGRYQLRSPIGEGNFSVTWLATDIVLGRDVAVKILREQYYVHKGFSSRFENEARHAALISHPNVIQVFDYGRDGDVPFIIMQFVPGPSLKAYIREEGPLTVDEAVEFTREILEGLAAIHSAGIIHRDVKPQNVLLTETNQAKLTDFGIARLGSVETGLTESGTALGTAAYMAPEQASGQAVSPATDLYSVGVIMYEMLTGRLPFPGENPVQVMYRHVNELPPPPRSINRSIPLTTEAFILRALAKNPSDRFVSARAMRDALLDPSSQSTSVQAVVPNVDPAGATAVSQAVRPAASVVAAPLPGPVAVSGPRTGAAGGGAPPRTPARRPVERNDRGASRAGFVVPLLVLLLLLGTLGAVGLAGAFGDNDEEPEATATVTVTVAVAVPTDSVEEPTTTPTLEPTATATLEPPTPTATLVPPTVTVTPEPPTATPEPPAPTPEPPTPTPEPPDPTPEPEPEPEPTTPPAPPVALDTPFPISQIPPALLGNPAVTLGADEFTGGYRRDDGILYDLPAIHLYGQGSGADSITSSFTLENEPGDYIVLQITGMDDERQQKAPMRLWLNDYLVWEGPSPFANEAWTDIGWLVENVDALQAGENTITFENLGPDGEVGLPPWNLLTAAVVYYVQVESAP